MEWADDYDQLVCHGERSDDGLAQIHSHGCVWMASQLHVGCRQ